MLSALAAPNQERPVLEDIEPFTGGLDWCQRFWFTCSARYGISASDSVAPDSVAPDLVAPDYVAPDSVVPDDVE